MFLIPQYCWDARKKWFLIIILITKRNVETQLQVIYLFLIYQHSFRTNMLLTISLYENKYLTFLAVVLNFIDCKMQHVEAWDILFCVRDNRFWVKRWPGEITKHCKKTTDCVLTVMKTWQHGGTVMFWKKDQWWRN